MGVRFHECHWPHCIKLNFCFCCVSGFDEYRIVHRCSEGGGKFKYSAVHKRDEIPVELRISGASPNRDPLKEIQLIKLRVDNDKYITGMEDCGDCVVRK